MRIEKMYKFSILFEYWGNEFVDVESFKRTREILESIANCIKTSNNLREAEEKITLALNSENSPTFKESDIIRITNSNFEPAHLLLSFEVKSSLGISRSFIKTLLNGVSPHKLSIINAEKE